MACVLAVDPGARGCGIALFEPGGEHGSRLMTATRVAIDPPSTASPAAVASELALAVDAEVSERYGQHPEALVLEWPQTYSGRASRGVTDDLFPLAALDGALVARFNPPRVVTYTPHDWKGSIQKPKSAKDSYIIRERVEARLSDEEKLVIHWPTNGRHSWDVADAIGIGLFYLGRFDRMRAIR